MKILLVNKFHYLKGGSEKYYFELAELLKENACRGLSGGLFRLPLGAGQHRVAAPERVGNRPTRD